MPAPDILTPVLTGAPNFRDLGGHRAAHGLRVRKGLVYRSEHLGSLTPADIARIRELGIGLVCDIRSAHERRHTPNRLPEAVPTWHLDVSVDLRAGHAAVAQSLVSNPTEQGAMESMLVSYRLFPRAFERHLARLFEHLLTDDPAPLVLHCTAGKDRTGFVSAILLLALGVSQEDVLEDYLLTGQYWSGERAESSLKAALSDMIGQPSPAVVRALTMVSPDYLGAAYTAIAVDYGSIERYLMCTGLGPQRREALQARLLCPVQQ